jgi:ABC-type amino acid transport substrate-binding protein/cytochrome c5
MAARTSGTTRRSRTIAVCAFLSAAALTPAAADEPAPFRLCADPDNLPFSSSKASPPGFYIELGKAIAASLDRPFEPVWSQSYFGKHTVRATLLSKQCDIYVGLPRGGFMGPSLIFSKPFLHIGYALMTPAGSQVTGIADLAGKRVAVQFATTPQIVLAGRDDIRTATFLDPEDAVQALARHEVDAAFIWGPSAGYLNHATLKDSYEVKPVDGDGMQFPVAIGLNRTDTELRTAVDRFIEQHGALVQEMAARYGLPGQQPTKLNAARPLMPGVIRAAADAPAGPPAAVATSTQPPTEGAAKSDDNSAMAAAGHEIFNGTCSHCHGPDAVQSVKKIDLRLLHRRYGDDMESVFLTTVTNGRPAKGMPTWSGVFSQEDFRKIFAWLKTIQTE